MSATHKPLLLVGAGGHAGVLLEVLKLEARVVLGMIDRDDARLERTLRGLTILGAETILDQYDPLQIELVNALGSVGDGRARMEMFFRLKRRGYTFASVIHPSAIISEDTLLGEGVQVMAGAVLQPGVSVAENSLINTRAVLDHDCRIAGHVHIAPGVILSGNVHVGQLAHIGTAATVIQGVRVGEGALIGAGALVLRDVADGQRVWGVPAKEAPR